jgi:hypothetical protein
MPVTTEISSEGVKISIMPTQRKFSHQRSRSVNNFLEHNNSTERNEQLSQSPVAFEPISQLSGASSSADDRQYSSLLDRSPSEDKLLENTAKNKILGSNEKNSPTPAPSPTSAPSFKKTVSFCDTVEKVEIKGRQS